MLSRMIATKYGRMRSGANCICGVLSLTTLAVFAAPSATARDVAKEVVTLRQDVDALAAKVRDQRELARAELMGLAAEKREVERQLRLETVRHETLVALEKSRAAVAAGVDDEVAKWTSAIRRSVVVAREMVSTTSPVHQRERLAALLQVEAELDRATSDPVAALEKLWRFLEEEEALSREVALDRQIFEVDGTGQLFDVVHLGLSVMYARSTTGALFVVEAGPQTRPALTPLSTPKTQRLVRAVFDAVGRGKREMPILLPARSLFPTGSER